jgi:CHASE2 domain-containing sensor protein
LRRDGATAATILPAMNLRVALLRGYTGAFRAVSGFLARKLSHNFYLFLAALFSLLALADVLFLHQIVDMRQKSYDFVIKNRIVKPAPDPDIVIVDIDEKSLAAMAKDYGRWPWPRQVLGEFVENLKAQAPRAVVFDVLFSDPDVFNADSDAYFNEVMAGTDNVYFPALRLPAKDDALSQLKLESVPGAVKTETAESGRTVAMVLPFFRAALESGRLGTFNVDPDADGIVRAYPVWLDAYGWRLPSLPAKVASGLGHPLPERQNVLLNWRGKPFSYRYASFSDVYFDMLSKEKTRPQDEFKGKVVLIGSTATGLADIKPASMSKAFPGVEILATAIDTFRHGDHIRVPTSRWPYLLVALVILWGTAIAFYRTVEPDLFARVFGLSQIGLLVLSYLSINFTNWFFNLTGPVFLGFVYFSIAKVYAVATVRALERNVVAQSLRGSGSQVATMALFQFAGRDDTSTGIFLRALKKAVDRTGDVAKDVEVLRGKQRGVFGLLESALVVSWVHPRGDAAQGKRVDDDLAALQREMPALIARARIAGEALESTAVQRLALGGEDGRVTPAEWRRLLGEALASAAPHIDKGDDSGT